MNARETIHDYYDALRGGDPLGPFFADESPAEGDGADDDQYVKFGIGEQLVGSEAIRDGLGGQTATTADWTVESDALRVTERACHAWFSDEVFMAWTDTERSIRFEFDTRWSGTLEARDEDGRPDQDGEWRFVGMHVSTEADT